MTTRPIIMEGWRGGLDTGLPDLYLAHDPELAAQYGDLTRMWIEVRNPLVIRTASEFRELWQLAGCDDMPPGSNFHPDTTSVLTYSVRQAGYDAIVMPQSMFDTGDDDELYELTHGTFGDPQTIILRTDND